MSRLKSLKTNAVWYYVAEMIPRLGALLVVPIWSARVDPADYGKWILISTTLEILLGISALGLSDFQQKVLYRYRDGRAAKYFGLGGSVMMVSTTVVAILMIVVSRWAPTLLNWNVHPALVAFLALYIWLGQFNAMAIHYLQCTVHYSRYGFQVLARWFINTGVLLYCLLILKQGFYSWVWAGLTTEALIFILAIYQLREVEWTFWSRHILKFALRMGVPGLATFFMGWGQGRAVRYALSFAGLKTGLGLYGVAENFASNYGAVVRPGKIVTLRILGHALEQEAETPDFMEFFHFFSIGALVVAFVLSLFLGDLMKIFVSSAYYGAARLLPFLIFGLYLSELMTLYNSLMFRYFKVWLHFLVLLGSFPILVLSIVFLVPRWGLQGAALAQLIGFVAMLVFYHLYACRVTMRQYRFMEKLGFSAAGLFLVVIIQRADLTILVRAGATAALISGYLLFQWQRRRADCPKFVQWVTAYVH